jgi:hypothetical protein
MLDLAAHKAAAEARFTTIQQSPQEQPQIDPLQAARATSPLLQYLEATKDQASTLQDADIQPIPQPITKIALSVHNRDEWNANLKQAIDQIKALGYEVGDTVPIRLILAKNVSEKVKIEKKLGRAKSYDLELKADGRHKLTFYKWHETGAKKADGSPVLTYIKDPTRFTYDWWAELINQNARGYGVYLLPNKGGHFDKDTTHWQNAFYEVDDRSLSQQQALVNDFTAKTGVKPSVVVRTRKSLHVYFRLAKSEWQLSNWADEVQKPTILAFQSDPSIINNARLMRLAGFYHVKFEQHLNEFNFLKCELQVCKPEREYTRKEYRQALAKYSGGEYSEDKLSLLKEITTAATSDYFQLDSDYQLAPKPHQIVRCPDELVSELKRRTNAYLAMLRKELNAEYVDPIEAWTKPLEELAIHKNYNLTFDDGEESDVLRWAQYLYCYNPEGRPGWVTGQDPTIPEDERDSHSPDSLHINKETGQFKSHRNTCTKELYRSLRELAFRSNPEEKTRYAAKMQRAKRKEEGQITAEEYKAKGLKPELTEAEKLDNVISLAQAQAAKDAVIEKEFAEYYARTVINKTKVKTYYDCNERYLSDKTVSHIPTIEQCKQQGKILALKAPKGTGKSYRIRDLIKDVQKDCWLTVSVTLRRNLGLAQSNDWGIKWVDEDGMESFFQGQSNTMSCCWDSLHKFHKANYRDKQILLIIDEVESGLDHLCTAKTIQRRGNRADIHAELRRIVDHIRAHGGMIIAADADLSESSVDFFRTIGKELPVTVIDNHYVEQKKTIPVYHTKDGEVKNAIKAGIEMNMPFLVATDSLQTAKVMHKYADKELRAMGADDLADKLWLIDSETSHTEANKARLKDINKAIREEQPIAIFYTPTINVGVSINVEHFTEGYGVFKGAIIPDQARQMVARNRQTIPWTIFADNLVEPDKKGKDTLITPKPIKDRLIKKVEAQSFITAKVANKLLEEGKDPEDNMNVARATLELMEKLQNDKPSFDTAEFHLLANIEARKNFQLKHYHKCFVDGMKAEGWNVVSKKGNKTALCDEIKELKQQMMKEEAKAIAEADASQILDYEQARQILSNVDDKEQRNAAHKFCVAHWTKLELDKVDAALVELVKFNPRWLSAVKLQLYLQNPEIIETIDAYRTNKMAKQYEKHGFVTLQDVPGKVEEVRQILNFGLLKVIDLNDDEQKFEKKDFEPLLKRLKQCTTSYLIGWGESCGISIQSRAFLHDPIKLLIKPMLAKMGYSITKATKNQKQSYKIPAEEINCIHRANVLEAILKDWRESQTQHGFQVPTGEGIKLEKTEAAVGKEQVLDTQVTAC